MGDTPHSCYARGALTFLCGPGGEPVFLDDDNRGSSITCHKTPNTNTIPSTPPSDTALLCDRQGDGIISPGDSTFDGFVRCVGETPEGREMVHGGVSAGVVLRCDDDATDIQEIRSGLSLRRVCHNGLLFSPESPLFGTTYPGLGATRILVPKRYHAGYDPQGTHQ